MPQLAIETFVSQYFWLVLSLLTLYFILVNKLIPLISSSFKARNYSDNKILVNFNQSNNQFNFKDLSLNNTFSQNTTNYSTIFQNNFLSWSQKI